jgi:succinoglycan biosynthesis protein ExoM
MSGNNTAAPDAGVRPHISICICTFKRTALLRRLLEEVSKLDGADQVFDWSCIVVDNDSAGSAGPVVEAFAAANRGQFVYQIEPQRSFPLVRNRTLSLARGDFIAFIDDDEYPESGWIVNLLNTLHKCSADGALGPVRPYFETTPPHWIVKSGLCERPVHPTGMEMPWQKSRTGNVLFKRSLVAPGKLSFDPAFASGGEDVDFFRRASKDGYRFVWCEEAPAYELVPKERLSLSYFIRRGTLQGQISLKYATDNLTAPARIKIGLHSLCALLVYFLLLPFLFIGRPYVALRFLVKCSHHWGRLFAAAGIPLMNRRSF